MGVIETVAVLFTDLVDSTGLLTRHGPEAMDAMRREHFDVLRRALGDRGREVKNVGDGLMVVFPSASVAADVAVAMQQAVARTTAPTGEALGLRVGMAVGDAEAWWKPSGPHSSPASSTTRYRRAWPGRG